jgi:hypothetical protein
MKAGTRHSVHLGTALALLLVLTARPESKTKKVPKNPVSEEVRFAMIQRAQIWSPVTISKMDIRLGPQDKGASSPMRRYGAITSKDSSREPRRNLIAGSMTAAS